MSVIYTDESLEAAADTAGIALADLPIVLGDPTHPRHRELVGAMSAATTDVPDDVGAAS